MSHESPQAVVVRFPTIMDGAVLRWYWSVEEAAHGIEMCSASRNGVYEKDDECPLEWLNDAHEVGALLRRRGNDADTSQWETHRTSLYGRTVEPIAGAYRGGING